jgi:hypothetical protein
MTIGELFIELGFKADTMKLKDFMHSVAELNMSSIAAALGLGTLYESTSKIMSIADQAAMSVFGFTQVTGISGKEVQQFSAITEQLGVSSQEAQSSLKGLQSAMMNVRLNRGNAEPFLLAGIDITEKDIFKTIKQLQDFIKQSSAPDSIKRMIIAEMGLSEGMFTVLKNTEDITQAIEEQRYAYEKQIETMVRFHKVNADLGNTLKLVWTDIASLIEPVIESLEHLLKLVIEFFDNILGGKKNFMESVGSYTKGFMNWLMPFLPEDSWNKLGDLFNPFKSKVIGGYEIPGIQNLLPPISPLTMSSLGGTGTSNVVQNDIDVDVSGVNDPIEAANHAINKLQRMLTDTYYNRNTQER